MFDDADDDTGTVFRDVITLALAGFVAAVILLIPYVHPPAKASTQSAEPPGNVVFEINWPAEIDADIDLWVSGPGGERVGYSAKSSMLFNLLRDDLGHTMDVSGMNYEVAYSRGIVPGEFVVNLHFYRTNDNALPVPVRIVVSVRETQESPAVQIITSTVDLAVVGQEVTVARFRLDADGRLVPGSVNRVFRAVRAA